MKNYTSEEIKDDKEIIYEIENEEELLDRRTIIFNETVTPNIVNKIFIPIKLLSEANPKMPIHLYLNTTGGSAPESLFISSFILTSETPIYTYAMGNVYSGGALMLISGTKRFAYKYSSVMFHLVYSDLKEAGTNNLFSQIQGVKILDDYIYDLLIKKSKMTPNQIKNKIKEKDWYLTTQELLKFGLIDEII